MKFVDYVTITVRSGKGGGGRVAFRREKHAPKGGPSGGDGGKGGSVLLEAHKQLYTLLDLRYNRHHFAEDGDPGGNSNKFGKDGQDIILRVPLGTIAREKDTGTIIGELSEPGERLLLVEGGRGGKGNAFFKSSTNQTPRYAQPGEPGKEIEVTLELRLLADVGLVGLPNVGKSTLVSSISAAKPKVANYPFTTLEPSLGVVYVDEYESFVIADIPGIIEGAHDGKGLGIQFLKHIERNSVLLFLIPVTSKKPGREYDTLLNELKWYNPKLLHKPRIIALSKIDLVPAEKRESIEKRVCDQLPENVSVFPISAVARLGLEKLKRGLWSKVQDIRLIEDK